MNVIELRMVVEGFIVKSWTTSAISPPNVPLMNKKLIHVKVNLMTAMKLNHAE